MTIMTGGGVALNPKGGLALTMAIHALPGNVTKTVRFRRLRAARRA